MRQVSNLTLRKNKIPWNKGLTKQTDERVNKNSENTKKTMQALFDSGYRTPSQTADFWTVERRKEKSEWRKQLHKDFPETHPNRKLAGNRNKMTYPEKVAFDFLTANNIKFEHQKEILGYFVDFCIDKLIIEIDGEQWHPIGNEKDTKRDLELTNNGYTVYRIRSKEKIQKRIKEILSL